MNDEDDDLNAPIDFHSFGLTGRMTIHFEEIEPAYGIGHTFNVFIDGKPWADVSNHVEDGSAGTLWDFCKVLHARGKCELSHSWLGKTPYFASVNPLTGEVDE